MKLATVILTALLLVLPAARAANAEPVDCEAARCTVQASIDEECPCAEAKNHGRYTACVTRIVNRLVREGSVPKKCRTKIEGCAIRSTCGKRDGSVSCQLPGNPITSRCRPLASESLCTSRGGTVVESCCETCSGPVPTATPTEVAVPTATETPQPIATETETPVPTETETPAPAATETATPVPTETETPQPVATETETPPVATETATPGPVATETATAVATTTPVPTETATPVATATSTPAATATTVPATATATSTQAAATATATAVPTATTTPVATLTSTPVLTATVTPLPSVTATTTVLPTATATTTAVPTVTATTTALPTATATATAVPTVTATRTATPVPTTTPTASSTPAATVTPGVGNGIVDPGEDCDPAGGAATSCQNASNTSAAFVCNAATGQCGCPTKVVFTGDPNEPVSLLDTGWTGISHRSPIITNGDVTVALSSCTGGDSQHPGTRPCGTCVVSGPIANPSAGAGQLDDRRCNNDPSRRCTNDATCTPRKCLGGTNFDAACTNDSQCPGGTCPAAGTCQFFFGAPLPLAAGGVSTCVANQFNGPITGTANVETGDAVNTAFLTSKVFLASTLDQPCPRCLNDANLNDGVLGGTCDVGPRAGKACDANGSVPGRPDFGTTSLDCPPTAGSQIATLGINLSNATATVTRTLTVSSPSCNGQPGSKCLCGTCNNGNNQSCFTNADCPDPAGPIGPICNGKRCLGGTNGGAACTANSECPSSSCTVPGSPTKPSGCQDDTTNDILDCSDAADGVSGNQEGACTIGPVDSNCTLASGHAQRGCSSDADCGGAPSSCGSANRVCFLTGGGTFVTSHLGGTDTLIAVGMADTPVHDVAHPTLGSVFCVAPTGRAAVDNVAGLPGPARVTIKGTATGLP